MIPIIDDTEARKREIYKVTVVGSVGNFVLVLFKFIAGVLGHSAAMIADAVHSLSDFVTDVIVLIFVKLSAKPVDSDHDYGHGKYETLATAIIAMMLLGVGIAIFWKASQEIWAYLQGAELEAPGWIALAAAIVSIVVKEGLYQYTVRTGRRLGSKVVEANAWHHRSDAFSSIGTTVGIAGAMYFGVKGRVLDPLAALVVSVFVIKVAIDLVRPCIDELLERSLPEEDEKKIMDVILSHPEASSPHNLRTRRIGSYSAVDVHVRMDPEMSVGASHAVTKAMESEIKQQLGARTIVNIHVEPVKSC